MSHKFLLFCFLFISTQLVVNRSWAQIDTTQKNNIVVQDSNKNSKVINLVRSDSLIGVKDADIYYNRLVGNVVLTHQGSTLTCDSAKMFVEKNYVEAFGNVVITTASGASCNAQYLKFNGNDNMAYLRHDVTLEDGENIVNTEAMTYNVKTKYATYANGGTLQNGTTVLTSNSGTYNGISKDAYFKGDVVVSDPKYQVQSKELKYNTVTKIVRFVKETTIITDNSTIVGDKGYYDAKKEIGEFNTRTSVISDDQQITANYMYYDKQKGSSNAKGNVIIEDYKNERNLFCNKADYNEITKKMNAIGDVFVDDKKEHRKLYGQQLFYNEKAKFMLIERDVELIDSAQNSSLMAQKVFFNNYYNYMLAVGKPVFKTLIDKDTLYTKADTFFSAPVQIIDTMHYKYVPDTLFADSTIIANNSTDTNLKRVLLAYHSVKIFSDSMQAVCDSLSYSQLDSMYRLYKKPILWYKNMQAKGDTILIQTINNKIAELNLINSASAISEVDSNNNFYDQVNGSQINAYLINEQLDKIEAIQNAESIYFSKNENKEYVGMNKSKANKLVVQMKDKDISKITFYQQPEGTVWPMKDVTDTNKKLALFDWLINLRPKSKVEILK